MKIKPEFKAFIVRAEKKENEKRKERARLSNVQPKSWNPLPIKKY